MDRADFASFLDSMEMDLDTRSYDTYDALLTYMDGSAAVIGTMSCRFCGRAIPARPAKPARQLGLAFQLTNFIRDVAEDLDSGAGSTCRGKDLERFGVTPTGSRRARVRPTC
jgi:phytoene synthase